jgi:predicted ATPase/DNA-binding SARP family transcriptional activator/Tfp pilus assembly protein PilF
LRRISVGLLGPFEVKIDGELVTRFEYAKVRALLAYLVMESHRPQTRATLATLLWPDQSDRVARSSLSQALTTLRHALGDKTADRPVLLTAADTVQIDPAGAIEVDVTQFLTLLQTSDAHAPDHRSWRTCMPCADRLRQALALYRGNFLADFFIPDSSVFEEWAALQREHLLQRTLSALERLAEWAQWRGLYSEAIEYVRRQVALEPLLEVNQRALMRLLALNGEVTAVLTHYRQLERLLAQELGSAPEAATTALFDQIRHGNTTNLQPRQPPFAVPAPPTHFIGRLQATQAVCTRLQDPHVRALTVTGTGGIGKTRLALEVAQRLRFDFEDGVTFVDLAPLTDAVQVADAVAHALGVPEQLGQIRAEALRAHLQAQHLLLVIDNFEHVMSAALLVADLLAACPALKVLVTSREPLNLRAEQQVALEPLADAEAVQLFVERAQAVSVQFATTEDHAAIYSEICRRLDGLPLAIELIAARARTLDPTEMLRQLDRPLQALTHGPSDAPPRHQTLRNALRWSYDLLNLAEQRVFRQISVFAGGCTVEAAQAVHDEQTAALPILEALSQASLLQPQVSADETRFVMLETLREFAAEQLAEQGGAAAARERHARYFAHFAESVESEVYGPARAIWMQRLDADHDNLRSAVAWCIEHAPVIGLQIAAALDRFYLQRGYIREGQTWLKALLDRAHLAPPPLRAKALMISGILLYLSAQYAEATADLTESLSLFEALNHDQESLARVHNALGNVALDQEQIDRAMEHYRLAIEIRRRLGNRFGVASVLNNLALCSHARGELDEAEALFTESLSLYREIDDLYSVASSLGNLASLALTRGDAQRARELYQESLDIRRELGDPRGVGLALNGLGQAAYQLHDPMTAQTHFADALKALAELHDYVDMADSLVGMAAVAQAVDEPEQAAKLLGVTSAVSEDNHTPLSSDTRKKMTPLIEAVYATLGDARYAAAWTKGRSLTLEQILDQVLTRVS